VMSSLELLWQDYADVSPGLAILLNKMTRHYIHQRYQSIEAVQHDLGRLEELPAEAAKATTCIETAMPQSLASAEAKTVIVRWRMRKRAKLLTVAISTLLTSACVLGLRQVGAFVPAELAVWDKMVVDMQPDKGPDPRLLIVEIKEGDLSAGRFTPSDESLAKAIDALQAHTPARIAVDLLRPPSVETSARTSAKSLRESLKDPNVLVVTRLSDPGEDNTVLPPPGMLFEQLSFSNVVADRDFRVRRSLMLDDLDESVLTGPSGEHLAVPVGNELANDPTEQPIFSLGTEAAIHYLEMYEDIGPAKGEILQLGDVRFEPITRSFGGYQNIDDRGYQTFIRYRSPHNVAARISFSDVINNNFDSALVKDKIVLIGATGANSRDVFLTPYNTGGNDKKMHGVEVHAQVASQILTAVIDGEKVPWAWPDAVEVVWIVALTGLGSGLMVLTQKGPILILFGVSGLALTLIVSAVSFELGGWVPMVAPMSAFFLSASGARISKSYQRRHWEGKHSETAITQIE
ncbi:MAG: CHASE2 domain-containing protein, partial [Cyanobacteria bacterium J06621_11]